MQIFLSKHCLDHMCHIFLSKVLQTADLYLQYSYVPDGINFCICCASNSQLLWKIRLLNILFVNVIVILVSFLFKILDLAVRFWKMFNYSNSHLSCIFYFGSFICITLQKCFFQISSVALASLLWTTLGIFLWVPALCMCMNAPFF